MKPRNTRSMARLFPVVMLATGLALPMVFWATAPARGAEPAAAAGETKPPEAAHPAKVSPLLGKPLPKLMGPAALSRGLLNLDKMRQEIVFIKDANGQLVKEGGRIKSELRQYALVISFFATYCKPCIKEIPNFNKIADSYADRPIRFLYVNVDVEKSAEEVKQFALSKGMTVEMMFPNPQQTVKQFDIDTLPRIVIADQKGVIREVIYGFQENLSAQLDSIINQIVPPGTSAAAAKPS